MDLTYAIDLSSYQRHVPDETWQAIRRDHGSLAIVQLYGGNPDTGWGPNHYAYSQLWGAVRADMLIAGYVLPRWDLPLEPDSDGVAQGLEAAGDAAPSLLFVAIDVEPVRQGWRRDYDITYAHSLLATAIERVRSAGHYPIIYTNRWAWGAVFGHPNSTSAYRDLDLWYAQWDGVDSIEGISPSPPWPSDRLVGKQYSSNSLAGTSFDLNVFRSDWVQARAIEAYVRAHPPQPTPAPPSPPVGPAPVGPDLAAEVARLRERLEAVEARLARLREALS